VKGCAVAQRASVEVVFGVVPQPSIAMTVIPLSLSACICASKSAGLMARLSFGLSSIGGNKAR
jgi:hypothetical protein